MQLLALLVVALFGPTAGSPVDFLTTEEGQEVAEAAQNYLEKFQERDAAQLALMGTDPFTFEGRVLKGQKEIETFYQKYFKVRGRAIPDLQDVRVEVFDYATALEKFGKPPKKFSHIPLKRCMFAAVHFEHRPGLLLILVKSKKEGWRVTAVTD